MTLAIMDQNLRDAADKAVRAIPPVWPLASSVAVNPFLGQSRENLATAGARLARVAGAPITMPRSWYAAKIAAGAITDDDLRAALDAAPASPKRNVADLKAAAAASSRALTAAPTIADLCADVSGIDWPGILAERIGAWAAGYFDQGQALWAASQKKGAWRAWCETATHDLSPEILGLKGFAASVADAPDAAATMIASASQRLGVSTDAAHMYFHALLMSLGGWAQVGRYRLWKAELAGGADQTAIDLLAIRLAWETALFAQYGAAIADQWAHAQAAFGAPLAPDDDLLIDAILQEAA